MSIRKNIAIDQQLHFAMQQDKLLPSIIVQMVAVGDESGKTDMMLTKVADFYEEEVDDAIDNLSSLLGPAIMTILGVIIGGLVVN